MNNILVIVIVAVILGAAVGGYFMFTGQKNVTSIQPATETPETPNTTDETPVAETQAKGPVTECRWLTISEINSVLSTTVKDGSSFSPGGGSCSRSWLDVATGGIDTSVSVSSDPKGAAKTKDDLDFSATMYEATEQVGDYKTSWIVSPGNALNFGKGDVKFQLQCNGNICSKEKAIALAKLVVAKV